jgi:hypothetical protein
MSKRLAHRSLAIVVVAVVLAFTTAALSHGHGNANSQEDSHCSLCMALHSGKQTLVSPVVALQFTPMRLALRAGSNSLVFVSIAVLPTHGRSPPLT